MQLPATHIKGNRVCPECKGRRLTRHDAPDTERNGRVIMVMHFSCKKCGHTWGEHLREQ